MPIPKPSGERLDKYISKCMKAQDGEDRPQNQKLAICYSKWREFKKSQLESKLTRVVKGIKKQLTTESAPLAPQGIEKPKKKKKVEDCKIKKDMRSAVLDWFSKNPNPKDDQVHALAEQLKINPHELESIIYSLLSEKLSNDNNVEKQMVETNIRDIEPQYIALAQDIGDKLKVDWNKVNIFELANGIKIEHEHDDLIKGDNLASAKIALAHLSEMPDYYTRLIQMEAQGKERPFDVESEYKEYQGELEKAKGSKYVNPDGTFKGGFEGCVSHFMESKGLKKENANKLCAYIGRRAGKI